MPTWRLRVQGQEYDQLVIADRLEESPATYTWWTVVVLMDEARWLCVRRISAGDVTSIDQV